MTEYEKRIREQDEKYRAELYEEHKDDAKKFLESWSAEKEERRKESCHCAKETPNKRHYDHPNSLDDGEATVLWLIGMGVSLLFKGGWIMCVVLTVVWFNYISRHWD